jgi:hypothetical protein
MLRGTHLTRYYFNPGTLFTRGRPHLIRDVFRVPTTPRSSSQNQSARLAGVALHDYDASRVDLGMFLFGSRVSQAIFLSADAALKRLNAVMVKRLRSTTG